METLARALGKVQKTEQAPPRDKYHPKPSTFGGYGGVEQFI